MSDTAGTQRIFVFRDWAKHFHWHIAGEIAPVPGKCNGPSPTSLQNSIALQVEPSILPPILPWILPIKIMKQTRAKTWLYTFPYLIKLQM